MRFKDLFSAQAESYAKYRPHYPESWFAYLASLVTSHRLAWDCATGNGQAALGLAPYFEQVFATDASASQLAQAVAHPKIQYAVAPAEATSLPSSSVDLVTVAQALHWFDFEKFYAEVKRVLRPGGVLATWCYHLLRCSAPIDVVLEEYYSRTVGPYWPGERKWIETKYRDLPFPFAEFAIPSFEMELNWNLDQVLAYLGTWSATQAYIAARQVNPLEPLRERLLELWGDPLESKPIHWPLFGRFGRREEEPASGF